MNQSKIVVRYSKALFILSKEKNILDTISKDMLLIYKICNSVSEFMRMIESPIAKPSQKRKTLNAIFKSSINELTMKFLDLLVENKREAFIRDIARYFIDLYRSDKGIKAAVLTTASEIDSETRDKVSELIKRSFNTKEVELDTNVNKDLIGGFILKVDDRQFDASISNHLKEVKRKLIDFTFVSKL
ncbi:MAG: ATP synthase F1 subunit delta [Bacteroidota bacterium]|nr:ATP synthase F1 subunit delta [Bacteroidota bacterium]MDP4225783.1 ATP synthase F1 subunit delta [Bacteroidota bacterium]MDP4274669.1 ATP synthase F1 subunit delta [Bacteroidota bacterium]